jgi:hypothetical protein
MGDTNLPITGICLVSKPNNVPTGYLCIRKAHDDTNRDADLMPDSILERKDRFLCITRAWPLTDMRTLAGDRALVLEDIKLINERDNPPANYNVLTYTSDTREKGTAKRLICVKMVDRQGGMKCVCDIIFLYRAKRPPQLYTIIGDINGLQMCVKEGTVQSSMPEPQSKLYQNPLTGTDLYGTSQQPQRRLSMDYSNTSTLTKKTDEKEILDGIPFEINPKYLNEMRNNRNGNGNGLTGLDSFRILSSYEIEQYYNYDFHIEQASI